MSNTPKDLIFADAQIECFPWEPDDKGGGHACIEINATIYDEKQLDKLIKGLEKRRKWLSWQTEGRFK